MEQVDRPCFILVWAQPYQEFCEFDFCGVFTLRRGLLQVLIGVPMSSTFGGDKEGQVAVAEGKVQAIQSAMMSKGCNVPATPSKSTKKAS